MLFTERTTAKGKPRIARLPSTLENIREELNVAKKIFNEEKKYSITEPILYNCNDKLFSTIKKLSYIEDDCKINFASAAMIFNYMDIFKSGKMPEMSRVVVPRRKRKDLR